MATTPGLLPGEPHGPVHGGHKESDTTEKSMNTIIKTMAEFIKMFTSSGTMLSSSQVSWHEFCEYSHCTVGGLSLRKVK